MLEPLFERFRQRDRLALSRLLSLAARGERLAEISAAIPAPAKASRVVALTGSGGVGKSTLIGRLTEQVREDINNGLLWQERSLIILLLLWPMSQQVI